MAVSNPPEEAKNRFRKASIADIPQIWEILQQAIQRRKEDGSNQWQDGYPNLQTIQKDIDEGVAYVLVAEDVILGYCALLINNESAYEVIDGSWLTNGDYVVFHRVAIANGHTGKGLSYQLMKYIEAFARTHAIRSVRGDTNFDNHAMMRVFEHAGYTYCGEVISRGYPRRAYEKVLD